MVRVFVVCESSVIMRVQAPGASTMTFGVNRISSVRCGVSDLVFFGVAIEVTLDSRQKEAINASYSSCWRAVGG